MRVIDATRQPVAIDVEVLRVAPAEETHSGHSLRFAGRVQIARLCFVWPNGEIERDDPRNMFDVLLPEGLNAQVGERLRTDTKGDRMVLWRKADERYVITPGVVSPGWQW